MFYDYKHNKDYGAFKAAVLKLFVAKHPFNTMQVKKDLKHFPAEVWNLDKKDLLMYSSSRAATTMRSSSSSACTLRGSFLT